MNLVLFTRNWLVNGKAFIQIPKNTITIGENGLIVNKFGVERRVSYQTINCTAFNYENKDHIIYYIEKGKVAAGFGLKPDKRYHHYQFKCPGYVFGYNTRWSNEIYKNQMKLFFSNLTGIFLFCGAALSQSNWVGVNSNYILDIYKPFSEEAQQFDSEGKAVSSKTKNSNILATLIKTKKFNWSVGISYKVIDFRVKDRIKQWTYIDWYDNGLIQDTFSYVFNDPADFVAKSKSYGLINQFSYSFYSTEKFNNYIGLDLDLYLFEKYASWYESNDYDPSNTGLILSQGARPSTDDTPLKKFFLSSSSFSLFYKFLYTPTNYFSVGTKILFGMNLQSDWDEFKHYRWLGFGVEIGIGKRKALKDK